VGLTRCQTQPFFGFGYTPDSTPIEFGNTPGPNAYESDTRPNPPELSYAPDPNAYEFGKVSRLVPFWAKDSFGYKHPM